MPGAHIIAAPENAEGPPGKRAFHRTEGSTTTVISHDGHAPKPYGIRNENGAAFVAAAASVVV